MPEVVTLGILVADVLARPVDRWPERGKLVKVDDMTLSIGGCAANAGVGLQRLGVATEVVGKVGRDGFGDFIMAELHSAGVGTAGIVQDPATSTSATMVVVGSDGERTFIHYIGANAKLRPAEFDRELVHSGRFLHVAGTFLMPGFDGAPAAEVLRDARDAGVCTCCDSAWDATGKWMETIAPMLPHMDYFLPSFEEAREITGRERPRDVAAALLDAGVGCVALKMGSEGCHVWTADSETGAPIFRVDPVDACGAGDAFCAGFIAGLAHGWDLERCAILANACGALCVTAMGATAGLRGFAETLEFVSERTGRDLREG
jgi:sugar/nucleoside kinase (ribokinase family)